MVTTTLIAQAHHDKTEITQITDAAAKDWAEQHGYAHVPARELRRCWRNAHRNVYDEHINRDNYDEPDETRPRFWEEVKASYLHRLHIHHKKMSTP